jgi:hypothetical protein
MISARRAAFIPTDPTDVVEAIELAQTVLVFVLTRMPDAPNDDDTSMHGES